MLGTLCAQEQMWVMSSLAPPKLLAYHGDMCRIHFQCSEIIGISVACVRDGDHTADKGLIKAWCFWTAAFRQTYLGWMSEAD